jgi:hypothetical protein
VAPAVVLAALIAAGLGVHWMWPGGGTAPEQPAQPPPEPETDSSAAVAFVTSEGFAALSDDEREAYLDRVADQFIERDLRPILRQLRAGAADLPEDERRRRHRAVRPLARKIHEKHVDRYFELPENERAAYLDQRIDRLLELHKEWAERRQRRAEEAGSASDKQTEPTRRARRHFTPEWIKLRIESSDPENRARRAEYHRALRERIEKRGLSLFRRLRGR